MFLNYLTIAFRNFWKNKLFSFVNLSGLALGMAVSLAIGLWLWDELSFDRVHALRDRVVQPLATQTLNGHTGTNEAISLAFGATSGGITPTTSICFRFPPGIRDTF